MENWTPSQVERELRFKLKGLARCCGRQGETIHRLRAELAEVRELNSKIDRGELRRLERDNIDIAESLKEWNAENVALRETNAEYAVIVAELHDRVKAAESMNLSLMRGDAALTP